MEGSSPVEAGRIVAIWRYPVKSMIGEQPDVVEVAETGVVGDRAFALIDRESGKVVSAKNPRRWPNMFAFRATYRQPIDATSDPVVEVTLPDGDVVMTDAPDIEARLSAAVGRPVALARSAVEGATAEGYWPDHDWLPDRDQTFEFPLPPGTFFDGSLVHLVTTASLEQLRTASPASQFDPRRFRPNLVIEPAAGDSGFVENGWIGRTLRVGDALLRIDRPTPRCVMTTLPQGELPKDPDVLRTAVQQNEANVGVYGSVVRGGRIRVGDEVRLA